MRANFPVQRRAAEGGDFSLRRLDFVLQYSNMTMNSGYHSCPCRDCFEIAIGEDADGDPSLCHACEDAGCSPDGDDECAAEHEGGEPHPAGDGFEEHDSTEWVRACPACNAK
jgi:hypothetical protein